MDSDFTYVMLSMSLCCPASVTVLMLGDSASALAEAVREMRPRDKRRRGGNDVKSFGVRGHRGTL